MNIDRIATHEAGHAWLFLTIGVHVEEMAASEARGYCKAPIDGGPSIVACLAGAVAEQLFCGERFEDALSVEDMRLARQCELSFEQDMRRSATDRDRRRWREQATQILLANEPDVRLLAAELRDRRVFREPALAEYAHRPSSALRAFRTLYPLPVSHPAQAVAGLRPVTDRLPPGSRWSAEHKCYLCPAGPKGTTWSPERRAYVPDPHPAPGDLAGLIRSLVSDLRSGGLSSCSPA